jgi:hypothetical protein
MGKIDRERPGSLEKMHRLNRIGNVEAMIEQV